MTGRPWMLVLSFLAFPPAGLLAHAVAGPVDDVASGLLAGLVVGAVVGLAQWAALRAARLGAVPALWAPVTAAASGVGLAVAAAAGLRTTDRLDLLGVGLLVGVLLGLSQAPLLPAHLRRAWALMTPLAWTLAWQVTVAFGVDISVGWAVFGASGALVYSTLMAGTLALCGRRAPIRATEVAA